MNWRCPLGKNSRGACAPTLLARPALKLRSLILPKPVTGVQRIASLAPEARSKTLIEVSTRSMVPEQTRPFVTGADQLAAFRFRLFQTNRLTP
jgi:hypothetical protein